MKALVADAINEYSVQDVILDEPKAGEVLIDMKATGVCHSDLSILNGTLPVVLPMVVGHEGAGIVEAVGEGVTNVVPGDHVALTWVAICGDCYFCHHEQPYLCTSGSLAQGKQLDGTARVHRGDEDLNVMTLLGCMAEKAVVPAISLVKIDKDIPFAVAALVGCGVMTGVGAAINTAQVKPGSTVAVFGCGGVGLSIIQGAVISGAKVIIAVDLADNKLEMAKKFGATHTFNGDGALEQILELTNGIGVDYAFEAVGIPALVLQANAAARRGGDVIVVGVGSPTQTIDLNAMLMPLSGKTLKGCFYGSANPAKDFPDLLDLYSAGKLNLDEMVTKTYSIDEAVTAIKDLEAGVNARGVIIYD